MKVTRAMLFLGLAGLMTATVGCSDGLKIGRVKGAVTLAGKPVPFAYLEFQPIEPRGTYGAAYTDADGKYDLQFDRKRKGAMVAQHQVTIRTSAIDEIQVEDKQTGKMVTPTLPPGYRPKLQVQFNREVKSGSNQLNFEIQEAQQTASR